jgi:hypothetical protein
VTPSHPSVQKSASSVQKLDQFINKQNWALKGEPKSSIWMMLLWPWYLRFIPNQIINNEWDDVDDQEEMIKLTPNTNCFYFLKLK